jgi:hypothetical protein
VSALATVAFAAMQQWVVALVGAASALVAGVVALVSRYSESSKRLPFDGRPLGRGPHVACDCTPSAALVGRFADLLRELREAPAAQNPQIDSTRLDGHASKAATAAQAGNYALAATEHLRAIRLLMEQLKGQRKSGDSSIFG